MGAFDVTGMSLMPHRLHLDIRSIPRLFPPDHHNVTSRIIMGKLKVKLRELEDSLMLNAAPTDGEYPYHDIVLILQIPIQSLIVL
jgi:hypothetical protein